MIACHADELLLYDTCTNLASMLISVSMWRSWTLGIDDSYVFATGAITGAG